MPELEELKNAMLKRYDDKFVFFELDGMSLGDIKSSMMWTGEDPKEFLSMAERLGCKIIYYSGAFPDTIEKYEKHIEEIEEIELGFLHERILHTMSIYADWYTPNEDILKEEGEEQKEEEFVEHLEKVTKEDLIKEIIEYTQKSNLTVEHPSSDTYRSTSARPIVDGFLAEKGVDRYRTGLSPKTRLKLDYVADLIEDQEMRKILAEEKEALPQLIKKCVEWAKQNGFNKLTRGNLSAFLLEEESRMSGQSQDILYTKVNFELKKK